MASDIQKAIEVICEEKGLEYATVMEALETALAAAYRKDFGSRQGNYTVKFDPATMDMEIWDVKEVVEDIDPDLLEEHQTKLADMREEARKEERELTEEEMEGLVRFNPKTEMMLAEAKELKKGAKIGETLEIPMEIPRDFGRMAAQTAKQVIIQKLREAERNTVFDDFKDQVGSIIQGVVQRRDRSGSIIIDLGKVTGILPQSEQIRREAYRPGARMRFFLVSVEMGTRGPDILLSRTRDEMVQTVFTQEIPEIASESVIIKKIARDPGNRSKVAVWTDDDTIDPIGSCIGQRGSRITTIIDELGGEKIDIIQYSDDAKEFIKQALSPAKIDDVVLDEETKEATVEVAEDQFSLAIGRGGQNVRLAAALTGWTIKVQGADGDAVSSEDDEKEIAEKALEEKEDGEKSEEETEEAVAESSEEAEEAPAADEVPADEPAEEAEEEEKKEEETEEAAE